MLKKRRRIRPPRGVLDGPGLSEPNHAVAAPSTAPHDEHTLKIERWGSERRRREPRIGGDGGSLSACLRTPIEARKAFLSADDGRRTVDANEDPSTYGQELLDAGEARGGAAMVAAKPGGLRLTRVRPCHCRALVGRRDGAV
jgi:hypothetical protein